MSCITEILKIKGDKEFLPVHERLVVEGGGKYKGYEFLVTFTGLATRCGYVALPSGHVANKAGHYDALEIEAHGGLNFYDSKHGAKRLLGEHPCQDVWIGFDCAHCDDGTDLDAFEKYYGKEAREVKEKYTFRDHGEVRDFDYVQAQCHHIIDQLIAA